MIGRFEIIREICSGKTCLDVGTVGDLHHHLAENDKWVYNHVAQVARKVVALDLDMKALAFLSKRGYRSLVCADAERFAFRTRFDVIVAGEIIEHLSNPGSFIRSCREHLGPDGVLVITTPNTFSVNHLLKGLLFGRVALFREHVNAYTPELLVELLRRHRMRATKLEYFTEKNAGLKNRAFVLLSKLRRTWAEGMLLVATADNTQVLGPEIGGATVQPKSDGWIS
jgi:2-polyprenyl-3-methyl-5-hydroxy-6-metoxy-1,4-benzoquinol methylase